MGQKLFKPNGFGAENDDRDLPSSQILLVLKTPVHRQQYVKSGSLCIREKFAILEPAQARVPRRLALVPC